MEQRNVGPQLAVKPCCLEASFHVLRFFRRKGRKRTYARVPAARLCCAAGLCIQEDVVCSLPVETRRPGRIIELDCLGLRANTWGVVFRLNVIIEPTDGRRSRQPHKPEVRSDGKECDMTCGTGWCDAIN